MADETPVDTVSDINQEGDPVRTGLETSVVDQPSSPFAEVSKCF